MTINFLKNDFPFNTVRIMAFDNISCQEYNLDLSLEDMLILVDGNQRLLEDDNLPDLFQILVNHLTMMSRKIKVAGKSDKYELKPVLAVEHRCFFNEVNIKNLDKL